MAKGASLTVIDPEGSQVSDLLAYNAQDVREAISNGRTFDYEETLHLSTGNRLWSNRSNPMLSIVEDTVRRHDFLLTPCSTATFEHFYPDKPVHRG
ncbi:MAG TPA: urea carboxylase-associated protein, partial [Erythrobacter sp.]|nr:urea carboxylase-associated protein [Erythrobacter sp.]